jgi:hypothetical protein
MSALAKLWTWIGQTFIPVAIAWAVYVRGGLAGEHLGEGVLISRGYWGLLVTLVVGSALAIVAALYVREARRSRAGILVPPNTTFDETGRSRLISWGTALVFTLFVLAALALFGDRYADSRIYLWDGMSPLASGFWSSRVKAHEAGCGYQPCYAMAQRLYPGRPVSGVNEYVLYLTDGALGILMAALVAAIIFLTLSCVKDRPPPRYGR